MKPPGFRIRDGESERPMELSDPTDCDMFKNFPFPETGVIFNFALVGAQGMKAKFLVCLRFVG